MALFECNKTDYSPCPYDIALHRCEIDYDLMFSKMRSGFCKNEDCPSSEDLLAFENGELPPLPAMEIHKHLACCEFCEAEVRFYSRFPQDAGSNEAASSADIPAPLFELAEALLKKHHTDAKSLNSLLKAVDKT